MVFFIVFFITFIILVIAELPKYRLQVDFANHESQMAFYRSMQASGQDIRDFYDILSERRLVMLCFNINQISRSLASLISVTET